MHELNSLATTLLTRITNSTKNEKRASIGPPKTVALLAFQEKCTENAAKKTTKYHPRMPYYYYPLSNASALHFQRFSSGTEIDRVLLNCMHWAGSCVSNQSRTVQICLVIHGSSLGSKKLPRLSRYSLPHHDDTASWPREGADLSRSSVRWADQ